MGWYSKPPIKSMAIHVGTIILLLYIHISRAIDPHTHTPQYKHTQHMLALCDRSIVKIYHHPSWNKHHFWINKHDRPPVAYVCQNIFTFQSGPFQDAVTHICTCMSSYWYSQVSNAADSLQDKHIHDQIFSLSLAYRNKATTTHLMALFTMA